MKNLLSIALLLCTTLCFGQLPKVSSGTVKRFEKFASKFVPARDVDVWLPNDYTSDKKYAVVYMHDGQMLFDSSTTWNHQEWRVDETIATLIAEKKIKPCIVVAVHNISKLRFAEYFPQKIIAQIPIATQNLILNKQIEGQPNADNYLKFLVKELKPFIDKTFSTYRNAENTIIMGSSMGGLISLYAICEYPKIFGGAGCISTHTPMLSPQLIAENKDGDAASVFRSYLEKQLPRKNKCKIYFDYGDQTLDAHYKPFQTKIDTIMKNKGYDSKHWLTREFIGDAHDEKSWANRLHIPLSFLLKP
jgi:enterochelin esterase-like enzyme